MRERALPKVRFYTVISIEADELRRHLQAQMQCSAEPYEVWRPSRSGRHRRLRNDMPRREARLDSVREQAVTKSGCNSRQ
jgi:hypothetical protein